jgi:hypothetical protein
MAIENEEEREEEVEEQKGFFRSSYDLSEMY